ncbi:hypothetical protein [Streptomyces griseosporeus]|uniref:hypothetical protein n=1 Tax=Streptomyces griseosporeus TaxID=1910 RepID=UPI0037028F60
MHKLSYALFAALAAAGTLLAPGVAAGAAPSDVTASQCIAGGGVIIIQDTGTGDHQFTMRCSGGLHDGETVV